MPCRLTAPAAATTRARAWAWWRTNFAGPARRCSEMPACQVGVRRDDDRRPPWPGHRAAASARGNGRKGARAGLWPIDTSRPAGGPFPPPRGPVRPAGTVRVSGTYELERKPWWSGGGSGGRADTDWTLDLGRGRLGSAKAEQIVANLRVGVSESDEG